MAATNSQYCSQRHHLQKVDYPGMGNNSQFTIDPFGRDVKIIEQSGGSTTSTKQYVWIGGGLCEERDGSGSVTSQFLALGQKTSGTSYLYEKTGACNNIVGVTNNSGVEITSIRYDSYGMPTILAGTFIPDFGFAGYFRHHRLNLTLFRAYNPALGRWLSRDPLKEEASSNLYGYVNNNPISFIDPLGLQSSGTYSIGNLNITQTPGGLFDYSNLNGKNTDHDQNYNPDFTIDPLTGFYNGHPDPGEFTAAQHGSGGHINIPDTNKPMPFNTFANNVMNSIGYKRAMARGAKKGRFWICELGKNPKAMKNLGFQLGLTQISAPSGKPGFSQSMGQSVMDINGQVNIPSNAQNPVGWVTVQTGL